MSSKRHSTCSASPLSRNSSAEVNNEVEKPRAYRRSAAALSMLGSSSTTATVVTCFCIERSADRAGELNRAHRALHRDRKNIAADLPLGEGVARMRGAYDYVAGLETLCFARRASTPPGMLSPLSRNNHRRSAITA